MSTSDFSSSEKSSGETVLHWVLKRPDPDQSYEQVSAHFKYQPKLKIEWIWKWILYNIEYLFRPLSEVPVLYLIPLKDV